MLFSPIKLFHVKLPNPKTQAALITRTAHLLRRSSQITFTFETLNSDPGLRIARSTSMERRGKIIRCGTAAYALLGLLLLSLVSHMAALSVTVNDVECIYEYVLYEGDTVSGNFVVVDHDIFWNSDHPGIDFTVLLFPFLSMYLCIFLCERVLICEIEINCRRWGI